MIQIQKFGVAEALASLAPGAQWVLYGDEYEGIEWLDEVQEKPTKADVTVEILALQQNYDLLEYQRLRAPEYPPIEDYIDGIVKNDQTQINEYIATCLAVKEKYPKPSDAS